MGLSRSDPSTKGLQNASTRAPPRLPTDVLQEYLEATGAEVSTADERTQACVHAHTQALAQFIFNLSILLSRKLTKAAGSPG